MNRRPFQDMSKYTETDILCSQTKLRQCTATSFSNTHGQAFRLPQQNEIDTLWGNVYLKEAHFAIS